MVIVGFTWPGDNAQNQANTIILFHIQLYSNTIFLWDIFLYFPSFVLWTTRTCWHSKTMHCADLLKWRSVPPVSLLFLCQFWIKRVTINLRHRRTLNFFYLFPFPFLINRVLSLSLSHFFFFFCGLFNEVTAGGNGNMWCLWVEIISNMSISSSLVSYWPD